MPSPARKTPRAIYTHFLYFFHHRAQAGVMDGADHFLGCVPLPSHSFAVEPVDEAVWSVVNGSPDSPVAAVRAVGVVSSSCIAGGGGMMIPGTVTIR